MLTKLLSNQEIFREICAIPIFAEDKLRFLYVHEIIEKANEIEYFNAPFGPSPTGRVVSFKEFNSLARSSIIQSVFRLEARENELTKMMLAMGRFNIEEHKQQIIGRKLARIKNAIFRVSEALNGEKRPSWYCQYRAIIGRPEESPEAIETFRTKLRLALGIENVSTPFLDKEHVFEIKIADPLMAQRILNHGSIDDGIELTPVSLFAMQAYTPKRSNLSMDDATTLTLGSTFKPNDILNRKAPLIIHRPLNNALPKDDILKEIAFLQGDIYHALESTTQENNSLSNIDLGKPMHANASLENCLVLNKALVDLSYVQLDNKLLSPAARLLLKQVANEPDITKKTIPREPGR